LGLSDADARQLAEDFDLAAYFEKAIEVSGQPKKTANWILTELMAVLNSQNLLIQNSVLSAENLGKLVKLIESGVISGKMAKDIFAEIYKENANPEKYIEKKGLKVMSDTGELEAVCRDIIGKNPQIVADFKAGKEKAIGSLVGQIMAATKGTANPKSVNEILRKLLSL
jgi:aspartyl-tRNA(Asn)/glutamyl-tRNA(Gln) amidotransferase subunit B